MGKVSAVETLRQRIAREWDEGSTAIEEFDAAIAEAKAEERERILRGHPEYPFWKGGMRYAVEMAWDASVSPVGDPEDGIEMHDLGVLADGIIDHLPAAMKRAAEGER